MLGVKQSTDLGRALSIGFPWAKKSDRCANYVACTPKEACLSNNKCSDAYLHTLKYCNEWQAQPENNNMLACNLTIQCTARQAGEACVRAIPGICNCPSEWEVGSFACSKKCVRDERKALTAAGCNVDQLSFGLARLPPLTKEFMNGAVCKRNVNATTDEPSGSCECVSAQRCSLCTSGSYYRVAGECIPCPQNPEMIIVGAILGILFMCVGMRELDKRKFNLAFISIGWDYFQVLALFADADIKWPPMLKTLFRMLAFFNIDIDIVAPECLIPDLPYSNKYFATMILPVGVAFVLFMSWLFNIFFDKCIKQRKVSSSAAKIMGGKLISSFLLGMYFMYLMITRRALEIFNCNPVDPDDGYTYTHFTSINCDGGLCRCWDPNHVQAFLVPFSVLAILIITVGFPIMLFLLLRQKKNAIKEDQYLRALDIEPVQSTNPIAFFNRLRYHKMYYHFKPGKVYWIVFIIARKGLVSTAGLLFRANPGFQLAFVLLVLFWAYVVQVKNQPFMSSVERKTVILEHQAKVADGDSLHIKLAARISQARLEDDKQRDKMKRKKGQNYKRSFSTILDNSSTKKKGQKLNYFWNYNTVERVLLSCLIIVCVCGVMFESDRFQDNHERPSGNGFGAWVRFQQELVTWLCIIVIFGSMFFYFAVMYSEIFGKLPVWVRKVLCLKKQVDINKDRDINNHRASAADMVFTQNEFMLEQQRQMAADLATSGLRDQLAEQQENMKREKLRAAAALAKAETSKAKGRRGGRGKKSKNKNKKKGFAARKAKQFDDVNELELAEIVVTQAAAESSQKREMLAEAAQKSKEKQGLHKKMNSFRAHKHGDSGHDYYHNEETGETVWTLPHDAELLHPTEFLNPTTEIVGITKKPSFRRLKTSENGREYYQNVDQPEETTWTVPADAEMLTMDSHTKNPDLGPKKRQSKTMDATFE